MNISDYIAELEALINSSQIVSSYNYDNAPDPKAKDIKTFPYHKHLKDGIIAESGNVKLSNVISEIEGLFIPNNE